MLVRPAGFEPATRKVEAFCSIQLSYGRSTAKRNDLYRCPVTFDGHEHSGERRLPHDPDLEVDEDAEGDALPVHLTPHLVLLVFVGGCLGVLLRAAIAEQVDADSALAIATFAINVVGAFALSVLIEALALRGSDIGYRRAMRLFLGTGLLGGFTTYSALAVQTDALLRGGQVGAALAYAVGTLTLGFAASLAGIALTRRGLRG